MYKPCTMSYMGVRYFLLYTADQAIAGNGKGPFAPKMTAARTEEMGPILLPRPRIGKLLSLQLRDPCHIILGAADCGHPFPSQGTFYRCAAESVHSFIGP